MGNEFLKFYGNSLIGTWTVPSTGKKIIPQLSYGKQRMVWMAGDSDNVVEGIEWLVDSSDTTLILMPWYNGEKLEYDEAM